jgi:lipopolysaccharide assembly protein A
VTYLTWLLKAAIFFAVFAFALNNQAPVPVHLFFGNTFQAPLVLVLLAALGVGIFLGIGVMVPVWWRARRQARQAQAAPTPASPPAATHSPDLPHAV